MPKDVKDQKPTLLERAAAIMDLPADTVAGLPRVEIIGLRQCYVSQHKGLLVYEDDLISVNGGRAAIKLHGSGLVIRAMDAGSLLVEGQLQSVEFVY